MDEKLSRRDLLKAGGLVIITGPLMSSRILTSKKKYTLPKTNEPLDNYIIQEQEKAARCLNISDEHCSYRIYGNCSRCNFNGDYALFITDNFP